MPDKAKLKVLEDHSVRLVKTCGTCVHSTFPHGRPWGSCDLASYQHEKHDGLRPMPAHLMFVCPKHEEGPNGMELGEYAKLIPPAFFSPGFDAMFAAQRKKR